MKGEATLHAITGWKKVQCKLRNASECGYALHQGMQWQEEKSATIFQGSFMHGSLKVTAFCIMRHTMLTHRMICIWEKKVQGYLVIR